MHDVARDAPMFMLPSDYEGLSNSMLEVMALGLPVICSDCPRGGARMVIKDGANGLLIPVGNEQGLCDAVVCLASDGKKPKELPAMRQKSEIHLPRKGYAQDGRR